MFQDITSVSWECLSHFSLVYIILKEPSFSYTKYKISLGMWVLVSKIRSDSYIMQESAVSDFLVSLLFLQVGSNKDHSLYNQTSQSVDYFVML